MFQLVSDLNETSAHRKPSDNRQTQTSNWSFWISRNWSCLSLWNYHQDHQSGQVIFFNHSYFLTLWYIPSMIGGISHCLACWLVLLISVNALWCWVLVLNDVTRLLVLIVQLWFRNVWRHNFANIIIGIIGTIYLGNVPLSLSGMIATAALQ